MVKRVFKLINRETNGLHQAAYLLGFFTVLSQVLGLLRDRLLAASFGASQSLDIYYAGFRIPDFIFITFGSMVSVSVLIPFLVDKMKAGPEEGRRFIGNIFTFFFLLIVLVSAAAFFLVPFLVPKLFPGFTGADLEQVIKLTRVLLLSPILLGLSNIFGTLTQTYRRFLLYALSPILYNVGIIAGVLWLYPIFGLVGLAYGVILGAFLHFAIQIPFIISNGLSPKLSFKFNFREIRKVLFVSIPRTLTLGSDNISVMFLLSLASLMTVGSITVFNLSYNLQSVLLSVIGVSYSLAVFPILIKLFSDGETSQFVEKIVISARHIIFWSLPIATLFIILRAQIVRTILGAGHFNWWDTRLTAAALAVFVISVVCQNLTLLFVRAYYATGNTIKPFIAKFINAVSTVLLGYVFMLLYQQHPYFRSFLENILRVEDVPGTIILTLPLGWSVGELLNTVALWLIFERDFKNFSRPVLRTLLEVVTASVAMGAVSFLSLNLVANVFDLDTTVGVFLQGFLAGIAGIIAGIVVFVLLKNPEIAAVWHTFKTRIFGAKVIPPNLSGL
jgi:putative peptidoglycan lipid II flippase